MEYKIISEIKKIFENDSSVYHMKKKSSLFSISENKNGEIIDDLFIINNGAIYINKKEQNEMETRLLFHSSNNITKKVDEEIKKIINFMNKYRRHLKCELRIKSNQYVIVYSNNLKKLIAYPIIEFVTTSSFYELDLDKRKIHKDDYIIKKLNEEVYYAMSNIIDKPLNQMTDDDMTVLDMKFI